MAYRENLCAFFCDSFDLCDFLWYNMNNSIVSFSVKGKVFMQKKWFISKCWISIAVCLVMLFFTTGAIPAQAEVPQDEETVNVSTTDIMIGGALANAEQMMTEVIEEQCDSVTDWLKSEEATYVAPEVEVFEKEEVISELMDAIPPVIEDVAEQMIEDSAVENEVPEAEEAEETVVDDSPTESEMKEEEVGYSWDGPMLTASKGVNAGPSGKETYYNLDMSGIISGLQRGGWIYEQCVDKELIDSILDSSGYWVRDDGCKMFGDYIMVAANLSVHPRGSLVPTSLGTGIVVDTGGFAKNNPNQLDIAVNW